MSLKKILIEHGSKGKTYNLTYYCENCKLTFSLKGIIEEQKFNCPKCEKEINIWGD